MLQWYDDMSKLYCWYPWYSLKWNYSHQGCWGWNQGEYRYLEVEYWIASFCLGDLLWQVHPISPCKSHNSHLKNTLSHISKYSNITWTVINSLPGTEFSPVHWKLFYYEIQRFIKAIKKVFQWILSYAIPGHIHWLFP